MLLLQFADCLSKAMRDRVVELQYFLPRPKTGGNEVLSQHTERERWRDGDRITLKNRNYIREGAKNGNGQRGKPNTHIRELDSGQKKCTWAEVKPIERLALEITP